MKNTKRSLITSLVTLLLCSAMFVGSSFAWFTDTVSNTGNKIQAGTLKIGLEQFKKTTEKPNGDWFDISGSGKPVFNYDKWEPGYSDVALLKVTNKGNLALKYVLNIKQGLNEDGSQSVLEVNDKGHTLADAIWVYSKVDATADELASINKVSDITDIDNTNPLKWHKTLLKDALAETDSAVHGVLLANTATAEAPSDGSYATMAVILHMDELAGNEYQGLSLGTSFDIELRAIQYTYEEDGFGSDQYDLIADGNPDHPEFDQLSVQPTVKKLVIPTDPANPLIVREPETGESLTVTESDMSVTYTPGTKLTEETKQAEDKKTADAKLGFVYESNQDQFELELEADQLVAQYELTLNLDESNSYLNKVVKHIDAGLSNVKVYHANKEGLLTKLSSNITPSEIDKTQGAVESYYYNETTGDLTLWVFHASPVEIVYDMPLQGSGTEENPYIVASKEQFLNIKSSKDSNMVYYKLQSDIELEEEFFYVPAEEESYYIDSLKNVCIDGGYHIISTRHYSYFDGDDPFIFGILSGHVILKNLTVCNGMAIVYEVEPESNDDLVEFINVNTVGTTSGSDNNNSARYVAYLASKNTRNINFVNCDNYSNVIGTGFVGGYVGEFHFGAGSTTNLSFKDCDNYGNLISTGNGKSSSMFVSNPTNYENVLNISVENCTNKGNIIYNGNVNGTFCFAFNNTYEILNTTINEINVTEGIKTKTTDEEKIAYLNDVSTVTGDIPSKNVNVGQLTTNDGKFVLPVVEGYSRGELIFSFTGLSGANVGHKFMFGSELPTDIKVSKWLSYSKTDGNLEKHNKYGCTYYTYQDNYVYNEPTARIGSNVVATFTAFDAEDKLIGIYTYTYGE